MVKINLSILKKETPEVYKVKRSLLLLAAFLYASSLFAITLGSHFSGRVSAAAMTAKSLTLSTATASATNVEYSIGYTLPNTNTVGAIEMIFCTTPLGTCTAPTGLSVSAATLGAQTTNTGFSIASASNSATSSAFFGSLATVPRVRVERTAGAGSTSAATLRLDTITNPSTNTYSPSGNNTFFIRFATFEDNTYATSNNNDGVVAAAIVPLLTVSARVQEILHFCVANTTVNDSSTTNPGADCSAITGTNGSSVDIGVADNSTTGAVSPDTDGNSRNGIFMLRTNAVGGTIVGYKAVQQTGTNYVGALRVSGATCTAEASGKNDTTDAVNRVSTDQCFNSAATKTALTSSVEQFGMTGRFINRMSSDTPTANLSLTTDYDSTSTTGYAWVEDGTFTSVATSVPSTDKVIDDEAIVLTFAAVAALTTPTGVYTAQADFIAVPTY